MAENVKKAKARNQEKSFFEGVKAEFNKIVWTDRPTLIRQTGVVVAVTIVVGAIISLMDAGILQVLNFLIK